MLARLGHGLLGRPAGYAGWAKVLAGWAERRRDAGQVAVLAGPGWAAALLLLLPAWAKSKGASWAGSVGWTDQANMAFTFLSYFLYSFLFHILLD